VAAKEFLYNRRILDSHNPGVAVIAFKLQDQYREKPNPEHTNAHGSCHASPTYQF
jgi:hypothetical protein